MAQIQTGSFTASLAILFQRGVRYQTVIDVGCADGTFYLQHFAHGLLPGSTALNIDANPIYEASLAAIKEVVGGHYAIAAATDHAGTVELAGAAHPYWNSVRPAGDLYWDRLNARRGAATVVPAVTLDGLADELGLKPPFLLKLDVQGAETATLKGATRVLAATDVVICEADIDDFQAIHAMLAAAGFGLFDITEVNRQADGPVGWFYPVYLSQRLDGIRRRAFWDAKDNQRVLELQVERRKTLLQQNALILQQLRAARPR